MSKRKLTLVFLTLANLTVALPLSSHWGGISSTIWADGTAPPPPPKPFVAGPVFTADGTAPPPPPKPFVVGPVFTADGTAPPPPPLPWTSLNRRQAT